MFVIPPPAGIQGDSLLLWTPAFAGVTRQEARHLGGQLGAVVTTMFFVL